MKVSIALCTFNGEKYIQDQLESILNQSHLPDEIIISDDGSSDETVHLIEEILGHESISYKLFRQNPPLGVYKNFEFCLNQCKGDIVFPCDQDDVWKKNKIESHLMAHELYPKVHIVYSNAEVVYEKIDYVLYHLWPTEKIKDQSYSSIHNILYKGKSVAGFCQSIRQPFLMSLFPFPEGIYHDDWMISCASLDRGIFGIHESLAYYRQHSNNVVGIVRGGKFSYCKSLFTNVKFYVESYRYIYSRHLKMFKALESKENLCALLDSHELQRTLRLYEAKSCLVENRFTYNIYLLSKNLVTGSYHHYFGFLGYLKDCYNLSIMRLFVD